MVQVVIHIDLDFFYGQVEQAANPSLATLPFAIQQKHIVVTCNYLARAAGVKKLQLLTDAKRCCPGLIIVNGEDIQRYRDASKAVFRYVRSLVGDKVQRLGMDELWLDVTEHVVSHYDSIVIDSHPAVNLKFSYGKHIAFQYRSESFSGVLLGTATDVRIDQLLKIASHLADFLRKSISFEFSFTSSAGISTSKLIAKLVGDYKKPDAQTCILPDRHQDFIDSIEIKKIAGVGYRTLKVLFDNIPGTSKPECRSREQLNLEAGDYEPSIGSVANLDTTAPDPDDLDDDGEEFKLMSKQKEELLSHSKRQLTVLEVRTEITKKLAIAWLGSEQGVWLWAILHAQDDSVIIPSSLYPKSIGVEDSFLHCTTFEGVRTHLLDLTADLIHRIEEDLKEDGKYVRSPTSLRLTPRFRGDQEKVLWKHKRISRSVPFPVNALQADIEISTRAENLVDKTLLPLFRKMSDEQDNWDLSLLNVAVADIKMSAPVTSIAEYLQSVSPSVISRKRRVEGVPTAALCPEGMDSDVWMALDEASRSDILYDTQTIFREPYTSKAGRTASKKVCFEPNHGQTASPVPPKDTVLNERDAQEEDLSWPEDNESGVLCERCSSIIPDFAVSDHICMA